MTFVLNARKQYVSDIFCRDNICALLGKR